MALIDLIFLKIVTPLLHNFHAVALRKMEVSELESHAMTKLLMVCVSNICRSPMALAVAQRLTDEAGHSQKFKFDSAGTHAPQLGERPDPRTQATLIQHGYKIGRSRSRRIALQDFHYFDLILAMDASNLTELRRVCPPEYAGKLCLLLDFSDELNASEIPDPYYGNVEGFENVLTLCEAGARGLLRHLA